MGEQGWLKSFLGGFLIGYPFNGNSLSGGLVYICFLEEEKRDDYNYVWLEITAAEILLALPISFW